MWICDTVNFIVTGDSPVSVGDTDSLTTGVSVTHTHFLVSVSQTVCVTVSVSTESVTDCYC